MIKQINFIKADLDTVCTAVLMTSNLEQINLVKLYDNATQDDLNNSEVLCIECGGDGQTELNNFDHHAKESLICACGQAFQKLGSPQKLLKLIDYISFIDTGVGLYSCNIKPLISARALSSIFSGMMCLTPDEKQRFIKGYQIIKAVINSNEYRDSPWDIPLISPDFKMYYEAKILLTKKLDEELNNAKTVLIENLKVMVLHSENAGIHGLLKRNGADISIAINDRLNKVTVSFSDRTVHYAKLLCNSLNNLEKGWGGHIERGIIASPFRGTALDESCLISVLGKVLS